ncbi:hypothetical protein AA11826_0961 [Komagataeibacter oboediens DSM 11826]|uniref:Uncharacterized protein n=1 Tax=Komagataeibacter oboediens TaxID=65958 RepID=A0A318QXJ5_9PROT|nr:hypothetical protein [Komagataeibacter oboediens]PYD82072.1 hypothetical protein CFR80_08125 [Komagataeibacter oboediens]GBR32625.1 hypothetical protein AA11826_0961 [Komagataeibacter oboediens DSM 11826]
MKLPVHAIIRIRLNIPKRFVLIGIRIAEYGRACCAPCPYAPPQGEVRKMHYPKPEHLSARRNDHNRLVWTHPVILPDGLHGAFTPCVPVDRSVRLTVALLPN